MEGYNEIYATQLIPSTSNSNINFTFSNIVAQTTGDITITVTAHNYLPNISTINVPSISGANPYMSSYQIIDNNTLGSIGNGDGNADAGETIALPITLTNSGDAIATNVTATLYVSGLSSRLGK